MRPEGGGVRVEVGRERIDGEDPDEGFLQVTFDDRRPSPSL